ncbi:hypothetical protein T4D_13620 [Trichinella pseudospiralis]|uniref:Uncharacterized protein n=1 Tax=Trichinella pseudospiralis TaxID=6337 RepID=A0A0V1F7D4_TRIPS|nr:hypothetical protein T4D_13620 [Trichinella pseudospiralis]
MSLSKRVGGRKANSDGDRLEENNKAVVDPLAMTVNYSLILELENEPEREEASPQLLLIALIRGTARHNCTDCKICLRYACNAVLESCIIRNSLANELLSYYNILNINSKALNIRKLITEKKTKIQRKQRVTSTTICRLCDVGTTKFCCSSTVAVVNVKRSNFPGLQIEGIRCIDIAKERKVGAVQLFLRSTELYAEHCW